MSGLLPSITELSRDPNPDPRVVGLESEAAEDLLGALSSETARRLFCALHDDPATPSALADRVGTSLQNAQYHLEKLENADLIEEIGTQYSAKGREMSVYAPANGPLVVYPGDDEDGDSQRILKRLVGGLAVVGFLSVLIEAIARELLPGLDTPGGADEANGDVGIMAGEPAPPQPDPHWLVELVDLSPGVAFFLGGTLVLLVILLVWHRRKVLL